MRCRSLKCGANWFECTTFPGGDLEHCFCGWTVRERGWKSLDEQANFHRSQSGRDSMKVQDIFEKTRGRGRET